MAKEYKIETIGDILRYTNRDNIDDFLADLKIIVLEFNKIADFADSVGVDREDLIPNDYTWIDDGKRDGTIIIKERK